MARRTHLYLALLLVPLLGAANPPSGGDSAPDGSLARRLLELEAREAALRALEGDLLQKIDELEKLRREAVAIIEPREASHQEQLKTLVEFYQAMKPKSSSLLLEKLPLKLAAEVLAAMQSRGAAKILNVMNPDRAVRISKLLAGGTR